MLTLIHVCFGKCTLFVWHNNFVITSLRIRIKAVCLRFGQRLIEIGGKAGILLRTKNAFEVNTALRMKCGGKAHLFVVVRALLIRFLH